MIRLEVAGVQETETEGLYAVLLRDESRILPIMVGGAEAFAIQRKLMNEPMIRPMTHDLICNLLAGLRARVQSLTIYKIENSTFFAHLNIEQMSSTGQVEQVLRVDSRPSDGIAIAVRLDCPIFASEEVMTSAALDASQSESGGDDEEEDHGEGGEFLGE